MGQNTLDWVRFVVLAQASLVFWLTLSILYKYSKARFFHEAGSRKIPIHIALIAASYVAATFFISMSIIERIGLPFTWRIPVAFAVFLLGDVSLLVMDSHIEDRLNRRY